MTVTLTTPAGNRVRTATQRRFVVVTDYTNPVGKSEGHIMRRSDNLDTLRTLIRRVGNDFGVDGSSRVRHIMDTVTKEVVR